MVAEMPAAELMRPLEPGDLPHEAAPRERLLQPAPLEHLEHRARRMGERPVLAAHHAQHEVLGRGDHARDSALRGG